MGNVSIPVADRAREEREAQKRLELEKTIVDLLIKGTQKCREILDERPDLPEVLTAAQAAKLLRLNLKTFYSRYHEGRIPGCLVEKPLRFSKRVILRWIRDGRPPVVNVG